jgi:hypothetical protein
MFSPRYAISLNSWTLIKASLFSKGRVMRKYINEWGVLCNIMEKINCCTAKMQWLCYCASVNSWCHSVNPLVMRKSCQQYAACNALKRMWVKVTVITIPVTQGETVCGGPWTRRTDVTAIYTAKQTICDYGTNNTESLGCCTLHKVHGSDSILKIWIKEKKK